MNGHRDNSGKSRRQTAAWGLVIVMTALVLTACNSGDIIGSSDTASQLPPPPPPASGDLSLSGRTKPPTKDLLSGTATPDGVTLTLEEAAISKDGSDYQSLATGPLKVNLDGATNPLIGGQQGMLAGTYKALRVSVSELAWQANWGFLNPSPCDGSTSGSGQGTLALGAGHTLYFKTIDLDGNSAAYYLANPPLEGYPGDADHPLLLPAPIEIVKDGTTTVNLIVEMDHSIGCSRLSIFNRSADGDSAPQREIAGANTGLFGVEDIALDTRRNEVVINNELGDDVTIYPVDAQDDTAPSRLIAGPTTRLNQPAAITFFTGGQTDGSGDQYILANRGNNSITTFTQASTGNAEPLRTISGSKTELSQPLAVGLLLDSTNKPELDEIWVVNGGTNSLAAYPRLAFGNASPIRTFVGTATKLAGACAMATDNTHQEIFVANRDNNTVTVYTPSGSGTVDPDPLRTIASIALDEPCGLFVDTDHDELIVTNVGNDSITVFPRNADGDATPIRTLSGATTGLHAPAGVLVDGEEMWVAHRGQQAAFADSPSILPAATVSVDGEQTPLNGAYNVIFYGVDLDRGTNGFGIRIPTLFARRGIASFNRAASPWPQVSWKFDSDNKRQLLETGCTTPDTLAKKGFYGTDTLGGFYAFSEDGRGMLRGAITADGRRFTGAFFDGSLLYVAYGNKRTGVETAYLSSNGKDKGGLASHVYAGYNNEIIRINRNNVPPEDDIFQVRLDIGAVEIDGANFGTLRADRNYVSILNPLGDFADPQSGGSRYVRGPGGLPAASSYTAQSGGQFENQKYGIAGIAAADGASMSFMSHIAKQDTDLCPIQMGFGLGMRQDPARRLSVGDVKGTYYLAATGDRLSNKISRGVYMTTAGTLTFDGAGGLKLALTENAEGELTGDDSSLTYRIIHRNFPISADSALLQTDVVEIRNGEGTAAPIATAVLSEDKQTLLFFRNPALDINKNNNFIGKANDTRLIGLAVRQQP